MATKADLITAILAHDPEANVKTFPEGHEKAGKAITHQGLTDLLEVYNAKAEPAASPAPAARKLGPIQVKVSINVAGIDFDGLTLDYEVDGGITGVEQKNSEAIALMLEGTAATLARALITNIQAKQVTRFDKVDPAVGRIY